MAIRLDPDQIEIQALFKLADFNGKRVLEIGCGDGRLTWQFAHLAERVIAIDPKLAHIEQATMNLPDHLAARVSFLPLGLEAYQAEHNSHEKFDLAMLSWSL